MSNIKRRIEKAEARAQSMEQEANVKKAKLREIQQLAGEDSMAAFLLQRELETGRRYTFPMAMMELAKSADAAEAEGGEPYPPEDSDCDLKEISPNPCAELAARRRQKATKSDKSRKNGADE